MNPTIARANELLQLTAAVMKTRDAARRQGMKPTEVWIGPEYRDVLRTDDTICDLKVRRSAESGIRVGTSYGLKG